MARLIMPSTEGEKVKCFMTGDWMNESYSSSGAAESKNLSSALSLKKTYVSSKTLPSMRIQLASLPASMT
jgi:hypothetical protein